MSSTKLTGFLTETVTTATAEPTFCVNRPRNAIGLEIRGTGASPPTWNYTPTLKSALWDNDGTWVDLTDAVTERGGTNTAAIDSFDKDDDALYVGCEVPFRAVYITIGAANSTASVATWKYWNGSAWADISDTDGTIDTGVTLAVTDQVTWSVPSAWEKRSVNGGKPLYYVQMTVGATLDSEVELDEIIPNGVQTAGAPAIVSDPTTSGEAVSIPRYWFDPAYVGGLEATGDNNDTVVVTWLLAGVSTSLVAGL